MKKKIIIFAAVSGLLLEFAAIIYTIHMRGKVVLGGEYFIMPLFIFIAFLVMEFLDIDKRIKYDSWVYIASPYSGDVKKNTVNAKRYALFAVQQGKVPMCPHIYFTQFLDDANEVEREKGMTLALQMLKHCREMWVFGDCISSGMQHEIYAAQKWNIPVIFFDENYKATSSLISWSMAKRSIRWHRRKVESDENSCR
jgi:hypothetical protein